MTTVSTLPVYPAPNRDVQVIFTLTGSASNFVRVWVTAAPPDSELRKKLDASTQNRYRVGEFDGGPDHPWRARFDKGGKYTLIAQEYTRGASAYGGGYQKSPDGAPSETKVGAEVTLQLHIGQRLTSDIQAGSDTLTVVVWVWDDAIRATTAAVHGEDSPSVLAATSTARALAVTESDTVLDALNALVNQPTSTAIGTMSVVLSDFISKWNGHLTAASVHTDDDTYNAIPVGLASGSNSATFGTAITEIIPLIRQHYTNDAVAGKIVYGRDSAGFHNVSFKTNDNANLPILPGATQLSEAYWALADLCRSYEAHRQNTTHHHLVDSTHGLADRPLLMQLGEIALGILASVNPVTPVTQSSGAMNFISRAGFAEKPL